MGRRILRPGSTVNVPQRPRWRTRKLPKKRLQLKLTMTFAGIAALGMLLQAVLFTAILSGIALKLPHDGDLLLEVANGLIFEVVAVTCVVFVPVIVTVGVLTTFRIAGPIYRFEQFLKAVARGTQRDPCRLRRGDELTELCALLNEATEPLRRNATQTVVVGAEAASALDEAFGTDPDEPSRLPSPALPAADRTTTCP